MAHPARYAVRNAEARLLLAWNVVLKLAWVAISMPIAPQAIDTKAPIKKAVAVYSPYPVNAQMTKNITPTKDKHIKYSCFKNSFAPYTIMLKLYLRYFNPKFNEQIFLIFGYFHNTHILTILLPDINLFNKFVVMQCPDDAHEATDDNYGDGATE